MRGETRFGLRGHVVGCTPMKAGCAVVYMNLGPYHIARLRALAEVLPDAHAIEVAGEQKLYPWRPSRDHLGFALTTLFADRACEAVPARMQCEAVRASLARIDPAVVIVAGYREPVMRAAAGWARRRGRPVVLLFVSTHRDQPRQWWREMIKSRLIRKYTWVAAMGEHAAQYAQRLGFPKEAIYRIGNVVDNQHFAGQSDSSRSNGALQRASLGLPDRYFVSVSRFSPEKNLHGLLDAFVAYRRRGGAWDLVLIGSGPQERQLREKAGAGAEGIHFIGWKGHEDLPRYYAMASCLILPSISEMWGLVVNEAMACSLPVLVSENCGCVPELCRNGENGFSFNPRSTEDIVRAMLRISSNEELLYAFGQASRRIVSSFTPQTWAAGLRDCVTAALHKGRP